MIHLEYSIECWKPSHGNQTLNLPVFPKTGISQNNGRELICAHMVLRHVTFSDSSAHTTWTRLYTQDHTGPHRGGVGVEFCGFMFTEWRRAEDVSVYELGIYFWLKVKSPPPEVIKGFSGRFISVVNWIRHFMRVVKKQKIERFPNAAFFLARKCSWSGVQFPYGTIRGARPWVSHETLLIFARFAHNLAECGRSADAWNRPYVDLPSFHSPDHTTGRGKSDSCNLVIKNVYVHLHTHALHNGHVGLGCQ